MTGDGTVMTRTPARVKVEDMSTDNPIRMLVLEEFRLRDADVDGAAARIVAAMPRGIEPFIPLLTSIEDHRDVAMIRALHADESTASDAGQRAALSPLVSSWAAPKHYAPRIAERSTSPPASYRLAVTEFGFNMRGDDQENVAAGSDDETATRAIALVWIGAPIDTEAGLVVLIGNYDDTATAAVRGLAWPLAFSRQVGVRIYENSPA